jgi:class 3 adenylate cyclase
LTDGKRSNLYLHLGEAAYALLVLAWFVVPLFSKAPGALVPPLLPVSLLESAPGAILPFLLVACIVTPIPVLAIFKIAAPFLAPRIPSIADPKRVVAVVLNVLLSGLVLATLVVHLFKEASGPGYFRLQSALFWVVAAVSFAVNTVSVVSLIAALSRRDDAYQEYLAFRREEQRGYASPLAALRRPGIQKRLAATFLPVILAIIVVPAVVVLRDLRLTTFSASIAGPSFRITVKVLAIAAVCLYAAVVLLYLAGRALVRPILYLRMSVSAVSRALNEMVKGKARLTPDSLQYKDRVRTQDEVKLLSDEIRAMTSVIRGVLPYVSASTLRHAERGRPKTEPGTKRNLAFLFTDIRGFSALCEEQHPDQVVKMLNRYLRIQAEIITTNGGDVDKFVGDEIVAMFDGPKKELHACRASVEIRSAMAKQRELAELASRNVVSIGIGINTGPVVFGSIGAGDRMDFTSIGDTVNLAARLEKANKSYRTGTLVSEAVHDRVDDEYLCREIDLLTVKGKRQPVRVFELMEERGKASDRNSEIKRVFEEGLAFYRQQKWSQAGQAFGFLKEKFGDEASEIFLRRIALFKLESPPKKWDGVFDLSLA